MRSVAVKTALIWMFIVMVALFFTSLSLAKIDYDTLVGLWLFDGDDDDVVKDLSKMGNDGTPAGDPEREDGQSGMALAYDGIDDAVEIPDLHEHIKDGFTVTFWLNKTDQESDNRWLFGSYSGWSAGATSLLIWKDEGNRNNLIFAVQGDKGGRGTCSYSALEYDKWNHIAATYDKSEVKLYVNGDQVSVSSFTEDVSSASTPWYIGYAPGNQIMGMMDEVAVFNVALNIDDIKEIMNEGLEQVLGITAVDLSGKAATTWGELKK